MEVATDLLVLIWLIAVIPLSFYLGKGLGHANGFEEAKRQFEQDKTITDKKVNQLAQNICKSYNMN
jgi:hypothetical protein